MASNKITKEDIFGDGIFSTKEIEAYKTTLEALIIANGNLIQSNIQIAQNNPFKSAKDLKDFNKALNEGSVAISNRAKADRELIRQQQESEKLAQQKIKTDRELYKSDQLITKEIEKQSKATKELSDNFLQSKKRLKELTSELLNTKPGTERFNELAKEAGHIKDQINDAKDAVKAFANESKASTAKTLFGQVLNDIKDLDFKGAADKARILADVVKSISFEEVLGGLKNLGSSLLDLGKAIFLNPLTAIVGAIGLLTLAIKEEYDAFKGGEEIFDKYNKQIADMGANHKEAAKQLRDLKLANKEANGEITKDEANRERAANKLKDKVTEIKQKEFETIRNINKEIEENNKQTLAEGAIGEFGSSLNATRIRKNEERKKQLLLGLNKKTQQEISDAGDIYREELNKKEKSEKVKISKEKVQETSKLGEDLARINIKFIAEQQKRQEKEINDYLQEQQDLKDAISLADKQSEEETKKVEEDLIKRKRKQLQDEIDLINKGVQAVEEGLAKRQEAQQRSIDAEIDQRKRAIDQQFELAAQGKDNELAFQREQLAKDELSKKEQLKKAQRQQEAIKLAETFLSALNSKLDKDIPYGKAASEALAETFAAKGISSLIAGSFIEGTENIARDLKGNKLHNGKDGYVVAVDGNERILNPEQNRLLGGISNEELVQRALLPSYSIGTDSVFGQNLSNSAMLQQLYGMNKKLSYLEKIAQKPETSFCLTNLGEVIETKVHQGITTRTKFANRTRI
jgi:hypothetical protein